ncbi:MAG: hypothetical protein OIF36_04095 [Alphaproteobacteria bacterium]|nr:hypothetical protein [Alphaproteobacteria bacterium]
MIKIYEDGIKKDFRIIFNQLMEDFNKEIATWDNAMGDFMRNMLELKEKRQNDKFYHTRANHQATERGFDGYVMSHILSLYREVSEGLDQVINKGKSIKEVYKDAKEDFKANTKGRREVLWK